ncbi:TPA: hypothetical protein DEP34_02670 [Candidatus Uhrbacteria bacterium]|uniref:Uncharacterized protein n=2 Tax=Candidatus Uhriibacteriota TaxID=1752732 RepID=A0A0G1T5X3_9BACT|nr:MAG: hypothetical protein UX45_C0012G0053 [Candidatus Uhrbacteria bacterium GW2011_GWF2_46_218]KKU40810.1 MAG: hypothetical protein UX57_C0010G0054 [Candidatus Uhrbacteria bacterium GW2011_GWE2_46_68]HBK34209.1 hypothetical protein [Candidatus Uhrbacteria bacterium]HCB19265.1 hypothetical protein [Candidatus Uhrbacteria bacterium]
MRFFSGYHQSSHRRWRFKPILGTGVAMLLLVVLFVVLVAWFRSSKSAPSEEIVDSITDVLTPTPVSVELIERAVDIQSREAILYWLGTGEEIGEARRGEKDGAYYLRVKTALPMIDRESQFYEVWLLQQIPYAYFSAGEMITNDLGEFVLEWDAPEKAVSYNGYTRVIITLEVYDENSDPASHVAEGIFDEEL